MRRDNSCELILLPHVRYVLTSLQDDLHNFHATHFASASTVYFASTFLGPFEDHGEDSYHGVEEEYIEDDGLGYYADGVKRTLTDEQIAIFRHSELEALQRAERHAAERGGPSTEEVSRQSQEVKEETNTSLEKPMTSTASAVANTPMAREAQRIIGPLRPTDVVDISITSEDSETAQDAPISQHILGQSTISQDSNKSKRKKKKTKNKPTSQRDAYVQPDLRKRTWDKVELDTTGELDY